MPGFVPTFCPVMQPCKAKELCQLRGRFLGMKDASEYLQHAAECRALSARAMTDAQREQFLAMAETWVRLAQEREGRMAQQKRREALE